MTDAQRMEHPQSAARVDEPAGSVPHQGAQPRAHTTVEVAQLVSSIEKMLQQAEEDSLWESPPTIYRVRPSVRKEQPGAYDPKVVSLGPFHRGREGLEEMEKLKPRFMNDLLARSPNCNSVTRYVDALLPLEIESARARYAGEVALGADAFLKAMVLDGCFLVECLLKAWERKLKPALASANCSWGLLLNDCLLIENQIPFSVVEALFRASFIPWDGSRNQPQLWQLATSLLNIKNPPETPPAGKIYHLLHFFHRSHNPGESRKTPPRSPTRSCHQRMIHYLGNINLIFSGALYSVLRCQWPRLSPRASNRDNSHCNFPSSHPQLFPWGSRRYKSSHSKYPSLIPCATGLRESGISITKRHFEDSREYSLLKVTFENGTLHIPFLLVDDNTQCRFSNLVALEQCCPRVGTYFTSYTAFMDSIINTAADVAELRSSGVVESIVGSDEQVAHMFNTMGKGIFLNLSNHYLKHVCRDVNKYCQTSRHRWRAKLVHDYFSSPWSAISVFVAFLLLLFTGLQAAFSVVAYYRPPK